MNLLILTILAATQVNGNLSGLLLLGFAALLAWILAVAWDNRDE